jgi:NitT/TauT family transport system permease protein
LATSGAKKVSWAEIRLWRVGLLLAFLGVWELATHRGWIDPFFVSRPTALGMQIFQWFKTGFIVRHLWVTMQETVIGFVVGTLLGVAVGFLFAHREKIAAIFDPLMVALNAMPRVVLAPLFILWFGLGLLSKVVMVVSLVFFVVFFSTYTGLREVDRDLINNARILGASPRHLTRHVLLPSALTWIFSSLRTSVGFALIGAVVGEYLGSHEGMGYVISYAESMFNATGVLAGLIVLMMAVTVIDLALTKLDKRFSYWKPIRG